MSSSKNNKKWKDKVEADFLNKSKFTEGSFCRLQDQITLLKNPNDVPLCRERIFERTVYRISNIDKNTYKPTPKKEAKPKNLDVLPDQRELIAEIDKNLKHLKGQKWFLKMANESKQNWTWGEHLSGNHCPKKRDGSQNIYRGQYQEGCDGNNGHVCEVLQRLFEKNHVKVTDSCTQIESPIRCGREEFYPLKCVQYKYTDMYNDECTPQTSNFTQNVHLQSERPAINADWRECKDSHTCRTGKVRMVNSSTQVGACLNCDKEQCCTKKRISCCKQSSLGSDLTSPCGVLEFLTQSSCQNQRGECYPDDNQYRMQTTYMSSFKPQINQDCVTTDFRRKHKDCCVEQEYETKILYKGKPTNLPECILNEIPKKNLKPKNKCVSPKPPSTRVKVKSFAGTPKRDSVEKDIKRMPYKPLKLSEEIENKARESRQKSFRTELLNQKSPRPRSSNQESPRAKSFNRQCFESQPKCPDSARSKKSPRQESNTVNKQTPRTKPFNRQSSESQLKGPDSARSKKSSHQKSTNAETKKKRPESQGYSYSKTVKCREEKKSTAFDATCQQSPTQTYRVCEKSTKVEINQRPYKKISSRTYKSKEDDNELVYPHLETSICSKSPSNNLSAASSSTPQRSYNIVRPNVIDDTTYISPVNDENNDYAILPYTRKEGEQDPNFDKHESITYKSESQEKLAKKGIDKSEVILEDASSREFRINAFISPESYEYNSKDMRINVESDKLAPKSLSIHSLTQELQIKAIPLKPEASGPQRKVSHNDKKSESRHDLQINAHSSPQYETKEVQYEKESRHDLQMNAQRAPQYEAKEVFCKSESPSLHPCEIKDMYLKLELTPEPKMNDSSAPLSHVSSDISFKPKASSSEIMASTSNFKDDHLSKSDLEFKLYEKLPTEKSDAFKSSKIYPYEGSPRITPSKTREQLKSEIYSPMAGVSQDEAYLSETSIENMNFNGLDPDLQNFIQYLQNRLKDCDKMVQKQLGKYDQMRKDLCQNTAVCKIEGDTNPVHGNVCTNTSVCKLESQAIGEGDRTDESCHSRFEYATGSGDDCLNQKEICELTLPLDSNQVSESEIGHELSCRCYTCGKEQLPLSREIPPFTGCECMREDYYKIMKLVYNK